MHFELYQTFLPQKMLVCKRCNANVLAHSLFYAARALQCTMLLMSTIRAFVVLPLAIATILKLKAPSDYAKRYDLF